MHFPHNINDQEMVEGVVQVTLGVWNPQDILNGSVCEVLTSDTYENSRPRVNGLFDLRMGTIEQGYRCETCHQDYRGCPGHFGHIRLARPVYHMQFLKYMLKIAKCFCYVCSECLIPIHNDGEFLKISSKPMKSRFTFVYKEYKEKDTYVCKFCGTQQPTKFIAPRNTQDNANGIAKVYATFKQGSEETKKYISCEQMLEFLKKIKDSDLDAIGIPSKTSRPDWMICTIFPVPPPHVRPSVRQENNQKSEDDLTHKLAEIIIRNHTLLKEIKNSKVDSVIDDWTQVLQYHVSTFINNEIPGMPRAIQRSGRPIKALTQRLQAKDGRFRYNLMGKRGDYTARTVITAEPNISLDELGIPKKIAMNLTFPEVVNERNIERLRKNVENGVSKYPGAKSILKKVKNSNGNMTYNQFSLSMIPKKKDNTIIQIGDIVHRHLQDGDLVFFNRQPSLHKMSMMGHRVRVLEVGNTFRLNVSATTPYNADFDGDEMNVFLTQCMEGVAELNFLTLVQNQIVSPQRNQCVIGLVQDTLFTCPQITEEKCYITRENYFNLMMYINKNFDSGIDNLTEYSGRSLFNMIIPKITMTRDTNRYKYSLLEKESMQREELKLHIQNGIIKSGTVDKNAVGTSAGGIIHVLWKDYNPKTSADFIYQCQKLCTQWLLNIGHSIGVSDTLFLNQDLGIHREEYDKIHSRITEAISAVNENYTKAKFGQYVPTTSKSIAEELEFKAMSILNTARDKSYKDAIINYVMNHNKGNRFLKMVMAGSKGDLINMAQVMCLFGQAEVAGTRAPLYFSSRSLPHYAKFDNSPEARGFSKHSYKDGLEPNECYFAACSTRIGLIDKTVKTADTGYTQRRLIKSMEDLMVHFDGSVRTANNSILQFAYGDDFFDATFLETIVFDYHLISNIEFERIFSTGKNTSEFQQLMELKEKIKSQMNMNKTFYSPLNIPRVLKEIINTENEVTTETMFRELDKVFTKELPVLAITELDAELTELNAAEFIGKMRQKLDKFLLLYYKCSELSSLPHQLFMFRCYYTFEISTKKLLSSRCSTRALVRLCNKIITQFVLAVCPSGEMVGIICGQSIGEPTTQMTLNTFHNIASGVRNTTTGVPRMKELLGVSKKIKTPSMTLFLDKKSQQQLYEIKSHKNRYEVVREYSKIFQYVTVSEILDNVDVILDNDLENDGESVIEADNSWVQILRESPYGVLCKKMNVWVIRLNFNADKCNLANIDMNTIKKSVNKAFENMRVNNKPFKINNFEVWDNTIASTLRIYLEFDDQEAESLNVWQYIYRITEKFLLNIKIKGIEGISSISVEEKNTLIKDNEDGSLTQEKEFHILTSGSKLKDILMFADKKRYYVTGEDESFSVYNKKPNTGEFKIIDIKLDKSRVKSNDVQEMFDVFGIEVARNSLIEEFQNVLEDTGGVNMRHITILVDTMTSKGQMIPIDRHGVKKNEIGPLSRATFEETVDQLLKAATFGEKDYMNGVSANIMMGQMAPCGTGTVNLLLDEAKILTSNKITFQNSIENEISSKEIHTVQNALNLAKSSQKMVERKRKFTIEQEPLMWTGNISKKIVV